MANIKTYITKADLLGYMDESRLIKIAGDRTDNLDDKKIESAINMACRFIDTKIGSKVRLPFNDEDNKVWEIIPPCAAVLTLYYLYFYSATQMPDHIKMEKDSVCKMLEEETLFSLADNEDGDNLEIDGDDARPFSVPQSRELGLYFNHPGRK